MRLIRFIVGRPLPHDFDHYNREELLYELDMALQENADLLQQLAGKHRFASITIREKEREGTSSFSSARSTLERSRKGKSQT